MGLLARVLMAVTTAVVFISLWLFSASGLLSAIDSSTISCRSSIQEKFPGVAFIHLPKCGGTSVWRYIHTQATNAGLNPYIWKPNTPTWMQLSEWGRNRTDVFGSDHINYHTLLQKWPNHTPDTDIFVTMFRDPRERLASHYHFVKKNKHHHTYPFVVNRTFAEFVKDVMPGYYLQFFVQPSRVTRRAGPGQYLQQCCFNHTDVEEVKTLLKENFQVVGILEEMQKTTTILNCKVPWINNVEKMEHYTKTEYEMPPFNEEDMVRATSLDQELYDYARGLLQEQYFDCVNQTGIHNREEDGI